MERIEITGREEIEVKRLYLPIKLKCTCPTCNTVNDHDLQTDHYLSYPIVNKEETIGVYCDKCDDFFNQKYILRIAIEIL